MKVFGMEYSHLASAHPYASSFEQIPNPFRLSTLTLDIRRSTSSLRRITLLPYSLITLSYSHHPPSYLFLKTNAVKNSSIHSSTYKGCSPWGKDLFLFCSSETNPLPLAKVFYACLEKKHPEGVEPSGRGT
jgi:hypothetical protein